MVHGSEQQLGLLKHSQIMEEGDRLAWKDGSEVFSAHTCYTKVLTVRLKMINEGVAFFKWDSVWINVVPTKFCFLVSLIVRDGILTQVNKQK